MPTRRQTTSETLNRWIGQNPLGPTLLSLTAVLCPMQRYHQSDPCTEKNWTFQFDLIDSIGLDLIDIRRTNCPMVRSGAAAPPVTPEH